MKVQDYLDNSFECSCGRVHEVPIKNITIEENALNKVPNILREVSDKRELFIVGDSNTFKAAGEELVDICSRAGYTVKKINLGSGKVVPEPNNIFKILEKVNRSGYMVACGSGTINDLTKFVSNKLDMPYTIVGTAPSMDGYTSSVASLIVDGMKKTYQAEPPEAIIADLNVLKEAPWDLIQSGFGDLLGKHTSLLDWKLSHILFGEYHCETASKIVEEELSKIMKLAGELTNRTEKSIETLTNGLINSGLAMLMVGSSRPASGSEHHISHFLEMYGLLFDKETPSHGTKVGLGTYFTSSFYLKLRDVDFSSVNIKHDRPARVENIHNVYQGLDQPILDNLNERWEDELLTKEKLLEKQGEIKLLIDDSANRLKKVKSYLYDIGILDRDDVKSIDSDWLKKALKHGFEIRSRFTVSTLLMKMGLLNQWTDELIEKYRTKLR